MRLLSRRRLSLIAVALGGACAHPVPPPHTAMMAINPPPPHVEPPPLALVPADVARTGLAATFVIPSLDRSLSTGVALVKQASPLPLDAAGVRDMLLGQAGLPPEVARHLDLGAPIAGAVVVSDRAPSQLAAFSFAVRSPSDLAGLLGTLGRTVSRRGDAFQIENAAGDRGWFLPVGTVVVFADTDEALVRAGNLAVEARRETKDDLSLVLYPEMLARAAGTGLDVALDALRRTLEERAAAGGSPLGPGGTRQVRLLVDYLGEVVSAELALDLDAGRGASVVARLRPKGGSKLEALAREAATIAVDPALRREAAASGDAGLVLTSAYGSATLEQLARARGEMSGLSGDAAKPRAIAGAGRLLDALAAGLTGQFSMIGRVQPAVSSELIFPARDAAGAARIEAALLASDKESLSAVLRALSQSEGLDAKALKILTAGRESLGQARVIHARLGFSPPGPRNTTVQKLLGTSGMDAFLAVVGGDRLALTMGSGAKARMAEIAGAGRVRKTGSVVAGRSSVAPVAPVVADAIAAAGPRSLFYFLDLRQVVSLAMLVGEDPRLRALSGTMRTPMPLLGGAAGDALGQSLRLDLTIPPTFFSGVGGVVQAAMMMRN